MIAGQFVDSPEAGATAAAIPLGRIVRGIIEDGQQPSSERRESVRGPYFCTAALHRDELWIAIPAYVHDISDKGIGFIHGTRIDLGEITAILRPRSPNRVKVRIRLVWCRSFGGGWHRSGGELIEVIDEASTKSSRD